jgi:FKBP-type peptidyl-prolyl cis-trans isomerase FkpA
MEKFSKSIIFIFLALFLVNCGYREQAMSEKPQVDPSKDQLLGANRQLLERDAELIQRFIQRRNWQMNQTESGLYYWIYERKEGLPAKKGDVISLDYELFLLDGTLCYSSKEKGPLTFKIGQGGVEAGLEEAALMLGNGDKARLILPPFLAHGLTGDQDRIPPRAVIVYELEVIFIKRGDVISRNS